MERNYAIRKGHLDGQIEIHPRMRTVLLDWISEVHTQYHFAQETFHITVATIDRYLQVSKSIGRSTACPSFNVKIVYDCKFWLTYFSLGSCSLCIRQTVKSTSRKNLQLVGVAALLIASKYEELYPPEVKDFVYITDNTYTKDQILAMEKHILKVSLGQDSHSQRECIPNSHHVVVFNFAEIEIRNGCANANSFSSSIFEGRPGWYTNTLFIEIFYWISCHWLQSFGISTVRGE